MASLTIAVRVQPRARRDEIAGVRDGVVPRSSVTIVRGVRGRDKLVRVDGLEASDCPLLYN